MSTLIACRREGSAFDPLSLDLFALTGAFIENRDYRADVADGTSLECPIRKGNGTFLMRASETLALQFSPTLVYASQQTLTNPTGSGTSVPQFYPNIQSFATAIVGFWQDGGTPNNTVLQSINPTTLAQTTLWTDFQTTPNDVLTGCGFSRDGQTWYYMAGASGTILALDLATGASTTFITPPASHAPSTTGTYSLHELANGTFVVLYATATSLRLMQYSAAGAASGIDVSLSGIFTNAGVFAVESDGGAVWVLGLNTALTANVLQRYLIPGGTLDVDTTAPDATADYVDLLVGDMVAPVPIKTPLAAQTPCEPESETSNGGKGHFGCNTGGIGWVSMYPDGPYDTVPQHADPVAGETFTNKRRVDFWIDWGHRNPSTSPATTDRYLRAKVELGHLPAYEGGRKQQGLKTLGRISHAIGNELHAFETGDVSIDYADQTDRLVRTIADGQSLRNDELLIKGASPEGVAADTAPRILARALVQQARMTAPMGARLEAVDQISTYFNTRKYPHWTFRDLGDAIPFAPADTLDLPLTPLYGEKSDEGADPISRGLIPGIYCGRFDLTSAGLPTPPDTPGYTFEALVTALQVSVDANTTDTDWGDCIGHADAAVLESMGTVPNDYTRLAQVIGYADLDAVLNGDCGGGVTAAPDDTGWGLIVFGLAEWFRLKVYGSDLQSGDALAEQTRVFIDPETRSDILHPDYTWPYANRYLELTNPDTDRTFWLMACFVRGQLLDDLLAGKISMAANAIGIMGNAGLPIIDAHACEQHWHENFVQNDWSSGPWTDDVDFPQWSDGTPKVNTVTFAACQALTVGPFGSPDRGLTVGWFPKEIKTLKACVDDWDRETESKTGFNGFWQTIKYRFDPDMDTSGFTRVDHAEHVFGQIQYSPGQDPENVQTGACDYDPDGGTFRATLTTPRRNTEGIDYAGDELPGVPIASTILNDLTQFAWVLDQRNLRLRFGATFIDVPRDLGAWDHDVTSGHLLTTIEGTGASGFVGRRCVKLRRELDLDTRIVTDTLWDVDRLLN